MPLHQQLTIAKPGEVPDDVVLAVADVLRSSQLLHVSESGFQVKRATVSGCRQHGSFAEGF